MKLQGLTPERPLTHDLFVTTLEDLGVSIDRVVISDLAEETFHARLVVAGVGRTVEVDARPSDALALAVRAGVRIFASAAVLEQAGLGADGAFDDEEGEPGMTARDDRRGARRPAARRLPRLRELARRGPGRREPAGELTAGQSPRMRAPRRSERARFTHMYRRRRQKSRTALPMTDGLAPVAEPAVRG